MFASLLGVIPMFPGFCAPDIYVERNGNVTKAPLFRGSYVSQYIQSSPRVLLLPCFPAIAHNMNLKTMLHGSIFNMEEESVCVARHNNAARPLSCLVKRFKLDSLQADLHLCQ